MRVLDTAAGTKDEIERSYYTKQKGGIAVKLANVGGDRMLDIKQRRVGSGDTWADW